MKKKPNATGSASLSASVLAFGGLYTALSVAFLPIVAFGLALFATVVIAKVI